MRKTKGINVLGYINKQFGLGEGVRSNIRSIEAAKISFVLNDFKAEISKDILTEDTLGTAISSENPYDVNLIQINVDNFPSLLSSDENQYFTGKYNIGFWAWELENFPPYFQQYIDFLDEIWVPSSFCQLAISQVASRPVLRFMHSIEVPHVVGSKSEFGLPEDTYVFLTMFDYHSRVSRKNPYGTIQAFINAFGLRQDTALIIKTSAGSEFEQDRMMLIDYVGKFPNIHIIEGTLEREKLYRLISSCDAYVSLHRSEGFGLTLAEAMAYGKPVIATNYSGNTEFMNSENSILVPYTMIDANNNYIYPDIPNQWADPSIEFAAASMLKLVGDPEFGRILGDNARKAIDRLLSPSVIGKRIKERLEYIYRVGLVNRKNGEEVILRHEVTNLKLENDEFRRKLDALRKIKAVKWKIKFNSLKNKILGREKKYFWDE